MNYAAAVFAGALAATAGIWHSDRVSASRDLRAENERLRAALNSTSNIADSEREARHKIADTLIDHLRKPSQ